MNARPARPFGVLAATAVIAAIALPAHAQSQDKPDGLWRGTAGLAGSYTSGNTDSAGLALNLDMSRATLQDKITLGGTANYARGQVAGVDTTTSNKWNGAGRYDYNLSPRAFTFGKLGFEGDKLVGLSWRASADAGMGYKLIDTPEVAFTVFGGAGYSSDRYASPQTIRGVTDTQFSRASLSLAEESRHRLTETVEFKQRLEVNPGISGDRATLAKFNAGLSVAMNSKLGLTVSLGYTHNNKPPDGQGKNDLGVFTGINYKLGAL